MLLKEVKSIYPPSPPKKIKSVIVMGETRSSMHKEKGNGFYISDSFYLIHIIFNLLEINLCPYWIPIYKMYTCISILKDYQCFISVVT